MTDPEFERGDSALPGMDAPQRPPAEVEAAARRTITRLHELGRVKEEHAVVTACIVAAARAIDRGASSGRASAVAMAMKELREAYVLLNPVEEGGGEDRGWLDFERDFRQAAEGKRG